MLRKIPFIKPMAPTLAKMLPAGPNWLHEVKFDGWRMFGMGMTRPMAIVVEIDNRRQEFFAQLCQARSVERGAALRYAPYRPRQ